MRKPCRSWLSGCVQMQDEDRIQVLRVEQRSPETEDVLNLVLDMAEEKLATAREKASPRDSRPLRWPGLVLVRGLWLSG